MELPEQGLDYCLGTFDCHLQINLSGTWVASRAHIVGNENYLAISRVNGRSETRKVAFESTQQLLLMKVKGHGIILGQA